MLFLKMMIDLGRTEGDVYFIINISDINILHRFFHNNF